ncbi:MAG: hypothetical protein ACK53Y_17260, partial [bacterium]
MIQEYIEFFDRKGDATGFDYCIIKRAEDSTTQPEISLNSSRTQVVTPNTDLNNGTELTRVALLEENVNELDV